MPSFAGDDDIGLVAFDLFDVVHFFADDNRAAGCRQHGIADDLECAVVAGGEHGEGKGIQFVQEFGVGITGEVAGGGFDGNQLDLVGSGYELLGAAFVEIASTFGCR